MGTTLPEPAAEPNSGDGGLSPASLVGWRRVTARQALDVRPQLQAGRQAEGAELL